MGRSNVMEPPIRTPDFILRIKGGIHTIMDENARKAKYHVPNQLSVYKWKLATKEKEIKLGYMKRMDPIRMRKTALEIKLEDEKSSSNPEIRAHSFITEKRIHDCEESLRLSEEEMKMVIERATEQYNRKISAYLHHAHLRREAIEDED